MSRSLSLALAALAFTTVQAAPASPAAWTPITFEHVRLDDPFWAPRARLMLTTTLPALLDLAEQQGKLDNFRVIAGRAPRKKIRTYNAADSDVYKLIEAAGYALAIQRDPALEKRLDALIDDIVAAQQPDGYLNTQFTLPPGGPLTPAADAKFVQTFGFGPEGRWNSRADNWPKNYSQMYCAGHLFEAGAAYYRATGKRPLLDAALRLADHMVKQFPVDQPLNYADHPEVETALMKLHELTGNPAYLALADHIVREVTFARPPDLGDGANRRPLAEQRVAWGHAVRTAYLYTGATDVVRATGADDLRTALHALWHSIIDSRLYVHGGAGGPAKAEQLQPAWLLDPALTYSESCANIAQGQWAHSLNLLTGEARYADLVELESYNGALSGLSLDGTRFFYSNLLAAGTAVRKNEHSGVRRTYLFCCPSKIPGFVAGLGRWVAAQSADTVALNQYVGGRVDFKLANGSAGALEVTSGLPWQGDIGVTITATAPHTFTLALRLPGWARGQPLPGDIYRYADQATEAWSLTVDGQSVDVQPDAQGYLRLTRTWTPGTQVTLRLPMTPRRVVADPRASLLTGRVAVMRGPLLYCLEQADNPAGPVTAAALPADATFTSEWQPQLLGGVTTVTATSATTKLTFVPYYAWENRGIDEMNVWLIADPATAAPLNLPAAEQKHNTNG